MNGWLGGRWVSLAWWVWMVSGGRVSPKCAANGARAALGFGVRGFGSEFGSGAAEDKRACTACGALTVRCVWSALCASGCGVLGAGRLVVGGEMSTLGTRYMAQRLPAHQATMAHGCSTGALLLWLFLGSHSHTVSQIGRSKLITLAYQFLIWSAP